MTVTAALEADAKRLLKAAGRPCSLIVAVDHDSILYLDDIDRPHTAWIHRSATGAVSTEVRDGFGALPPWGLHDEAGLVPLNNLPHMQPKPRF